MSYPLAKISVSINSLLAWLVSVEIRLVQRIASSEITRVIIDSVNLGSGPAKHADHRKEKKKRKICNGVSSTVVKLCSPRPFFILSLRRRGLSRSGLLTYSFPGMR